MNWKTVVASLLGISAYTPAKPGMGVSLDSPAVESARENLGGQLAPLPQTRTRWYLADLETAELQADAGDMDLAAQLMRSARKDGVFAGVLSTRTGGLVRLPKKFRGRSDIVDALELGHDSVRSVFDEMLPPSELALLAGDGLLLGVGVAELVPVEGRDYPVLQRHDPQWLVYRWTENRWYYRSVVGLIPITPGDGRWVLHTPGGRIAPWQNGLWRAIGRSWIEKEHARMHKSNWEGKLANPARVAVAPQGASENQKQSWWKAVMAWGVNSVFGLTPGYDVKLLESNGRGWESFNTTIQQDNEDMITAIAGQLVTTTGGTGFANADIHKSIRADLIKETADGLAYTVNTQCLPMFVVQRFGVDALEESAIVEWSVDPPKDRNAEAMAQVTAANALKLLGEALGAYGSQIDLKTFCVRFGIDLADLNTARPETERTIGESVVTEVLPVYTGAPKPEPNQEESEAA